MEQLERETEVIINKFAVLVSRTLSLLIERKITVERLIVLIELFRSPDSKGSKLIKKLKKVHELDKAFRILYHYWSFFDYELLGAMIDSFCEELKSDMHEYIQKFIHYGNRRVCEIPEDSFSKIRSDFTPAINMCVQVDRFFVNEIGRLKVKELKDIASKLGIILDTNLCVIKVEAGSIVIIFNCFEELDLLFPLSEEKKEKLQDIGVVRIYTEEQEYYSSK